MPREHRQMNNEGTTKLACYILLEITPRGIMVEASGPVCSAATLKQFRRTETDIAQLCITAHLL